MAPQQFLPTTLKDGTLDTLVHLVNNLLGRLKRRSNQQDRLFPFPALPAHTAASTAIPGAVGGDNTIAASSTSNADTSIALDAGARSTRDPPPTAEATLPEAHSDPEVEHKEGGREGDRHAAESLCHADAILARAVLCPAGAAYAFSVARRERKRAERALGAAADGAGAGGGEERQHAAAPAVERGNLSWVTIEHGAWAAERVVEELTAWKRGQARGRGERGMAIAAAAVARDSVVVQ